MTDIARQAVVDTPVRRIYPVRPDWAPLPDEALDRLVRDIGGAPPLVRTRRRMDRVAL